MIYRSSLEPRFVAASAAAAVLTILAGAAAALSAPALGPALRPLAAAGVLFVIAGGINLFTAIRVRYELDDFELVVRRGIWRTRIPLECIEGVLPVRHAQDTPRPRPDHITVVYQRDGRPGVAVLTPGDPDRFLRDLARGAPFLEVVGDRLLRKPGLLTTS
jgi:hypothetical protein